VQVDAARLAPQAQLATSGVTPQPTSDALPIDASDDPIWGSPNAPVTIVEFSDLQCPFCARVQPTIKALQAKYGPNQLRVVFKHNPLPFHQNALPAAKVADAVFHQGGAPAFFDFLDLAFAMQQDLGNDGLKSWVTRTGLDPMAVARRGDLPLTADKIQRDIALAAKIGANGTPGFRINGATLNGAQPIESFTAIIDAELKAAADLRAKGTPPGAIYKARVAANFVAPAATAKNQKDDDDDDLAIYKVPVKGAPFTGPADALVTIVEFFDYQCPFCRRVDGTMTELKKLYPKDVRVVLRQNPLPFHPRAVPAANFALEARAEKGDAAFLEANRRLLEGSLEEADLVQLGHELKLNDKRVHDAITGPAFAAVEADMDLADDLKARGTPHFFINGQRLSGAQPLENFVAAVEAQLKIANALVAAGTPRAGVYEEIMKQGKDADPPEKKQMPAISAENPSKGPLNAPIVIHEFSDFQCPFCSRVEPTLAELEKAFPNKLRIVWHDFPLPFHQNARPAAIAAREVRAQKGDAAFWKLHDLLYRDQKVEDAFSPALFDKYAAELHFDAARVALAQTDGRYDAALARDKAIADAASINGTPAFIINGYFVSGAQNLSAFKRVVRRALADQQRLKLAGPALKH
jgi:protein-disulfide isomerase